ncbi:protein MCM10 homolog [Ruditapes philippinarum]|uniref:protein MCM10 homolog n=1 Tax=Ruditapes philippinarum TaxID=129788 RepID=UPI00295AE227|nr:protein MCM10 homolog [Ruditapes philippinarum]
MPNYDPAVLKKPNISRWTETNSKPLRIHPIQQVSQKPALDPVTGTVSGKYKVKDEYMQKSTITKEDVRESVTDPFCGIRIINPRVPMDVFKRKMEGRNLVKISRLVSKMGTDLQKDNWVTLGVVVHKTEPRQSAAGKAYCIWKLSDLQNCDKTVTFFLFGNVYKEHWKNDLGVVIGLLNPSIMDKAEKNQAELAITINHPQQLLMMGISKDLGRCRGTTKAGSPCSSFINKMQGEFCTYHVQSAYRKSSSKRTELQASTGITPKAFTQQKNKNAGSGCFFYGGNTYTTQRPQAKSSKDKMTLNKLQSFEAKKAPGKITTLSLHDLEPDDEKKIDKLRQKDKDLLQLLSVPSAGSMNFVKHLVKKDANPTVNKIDEGDIVPSASAKDLLKQHSKTLLQKKKEVELLTSTPTLGKGIGFGQEISLDAPINKGKGKASAELAKRLAIAKIKSKGGVNKEDPNSVRKKITSPEAREKIRKRVAEDMEDDNTGDSSSKEPPQKKSKLLGDLDLNSPDVQQLLKKKSKHKGALAEAESEQEERYFSALEKKEQMEDKMGAIMEVPVKLFMCLQCNYRYFSIHERCKKENHPTKQVKGVKRFFKCKHCKRRTVSIDRLPTKPCKDCGSSNWERVSMLKERNGPKLESEELCLRGNEQKFIGSLQGKASFNG